MQNTRIQLFGNPKGYLETDKDTIVPLTFAIADIKDLSKRKGTFSKSITLPGTKNNNIMLNNYFEVNVLAGTFDINRIVKCAIIQDGVVILDNAVMQLVSVNKTQNNSMAEDTHTYTILIKDTTSDLFTKISNKRLEDIDLTFGDHIYTAENVIASFDHTISDGYKYVMPYNPAVVDDINFRLEEFTPAIYARKYFDKIFNDAGFAYNWPSANDDDIQFDKLVIPYNGGEPTVRNLPVNSYTVQALAKSAATISNTYGLPNDITSVRYRIKQFPFNTNVIVRPWTEVSDPQNLFNPLNGGYTAPNAFPSSTFNLRFKVKASYIIKVKNNATQARELRVNNNTNPSGDYRMILSPSLSIKNSSGLNLTTQRLGSFSLPTGYIVPSGSTVTLNSGTNEFEFIVNGIDPNMGFTLNEVMLVESNLNNGVAWYSFNSVGSPTIYTTDVNIQYLLEDIEYEITPLIDENVGYNVPITLNRFIPKDIKQSDFLKSIFTMFNLYVEVDADNPSILNIYKRNEFYDNGKIENWTEKLCKEKPQDIKFLPEISNKKLLLTYKEDKDWANETYKKLTGEIYGQALFTFDNEYVQDESKIELIFSPTPMKNSSFGAILPMWNGESPETNIRILYDGGEYTCGQYKIWNYPSTQTIVESIVTGTTFPLITHWDKPFSPTYDLNFIAPDFYFRTDDFGSNTNNNLFNLHWRRTMYQINNGRLLTAYFNLTAYDIQKMKLSDKIRIDNSWWNINKIIDYNSNSNEPTKVELINIDDELQIDFTPQNSDRLRQSSSKLIGLNDLTRNLVRTKNTIYSEGIIEINGFNNTISIDSNFNLVSGNSNMIGKDNIIFGNENNVMSQSLIIGNNNNVGENTSSIVIGSDNILSDGLTSSIVLGQGITADTSNSLYTNNIFFPNNGTINNIPIKDFLSGNTNYISGSTGPYSIITIQNPSKPNVASGIYSMATGNGAVSSLPGEWSRTTGDANNVFTPQYGILDLSSRTTNATLTEIFIGGITNSRVSIASGQSLRYKFTAIAMTEGTIASKEWEGQGLIRNVTGTTTLIGYDIISTYADASMATADLTVSADNTNDSLKFEVTGIASTNIRWYVKVDYIKI
jgi:hypothetical protein